MMLSFATLIQILRKKYPSSAVVVTNSVYDAECAWVKIHNGFPGAGSCMYDFSKQLAYGIDTHWMELIEEKFFENAARYEIVRRQKHEDEQIKQAEEQFNNGLASDLFSEEAYDKDHAFSVAESEGWPSNPSHDY